MSSSLPVERDGAARLVGDVMQSVFATVRSDELMDLVHDVMCLGRVRHLPVVDGGRLVGVVSQRDLLAAGLSQALEFDRAQRRSFLRTVAVSEVMTGHPTSVRTGTSLEEAAALMLDQRIGCLPVVDDDLQPIGLLTETDLLRVAYSPTGSA